MKKILTLIIVSVVLLIIIAGILSFKPSISGNVVSNTNGIFVGEKNTSTIGGVEVNIERDQNQVKMVVEGLEIMARVELEERERKIYAKTSSGESEVKVIPSDAIDKASKISQVSSMEIEEYKGQAVYSIYGTKRARLFFIIPLTADVNQKINVEDGEVVYTKKPWWHFLALGV